MATSDPKGRKRNWKRVSAVDPVGIACKAYFSGWAGTHCTTGIQLHGLGAVTPIAFWHKPNPRVQMHTYSSLITRGRVAKNFAFLQTPRKNEQNQKTKKTNMPRTVKFIHSP